MGYRCCAALLTIGMNACCALHADDGPMPGSHARQDHAAVQADPYQLRPMATLNIDSSPNASGNASKEESPPHSPAAQRLLTRYYAGAYREVGQDGLLLIEQEPNNAELRFVVANSLAWSGYTGEALAQYAALQDSQYHDRALLGLAHVNRWTGRPDRAAAAYREVLRKEPANDDARNGLMLANRALRTSTGARLGHASNSNNASRVWSTLNHRWRDEPGSRIFELEAGVLDEDKDDVHVVQRDLTFQYEDLDARFSPRLKISAQQSPKTSLFGSLALKLADAPVYLSAGRINWGKLAFDPRALRDGLTASQLGGEAGFRNPLGEFKMAYNAYRVSDGNLVQEFNLRITPSRQPFGSPHIRAFTGVEARKARFFDPRYWSPEKGHYNVFAGIGADWSNEHWETYGAVQYGVPLTDDSGRSWSAGFGVKRWLGKNWAASFDLWAIDNPRNGGYKSNSATLWIERLW